MIRSAIQFLTFEAAGALPQAFMCRLLWDDARAFKSDAAIASQKHDGNIAEILPDAAAQPRPQIAPDRRVIPLAGGQAGVDRTEPVGERVLDCRNANVARHRRESQR